MKAIALISTALMILSLTGCASKPGPYANDPRCAGLNQNTLYPWIGPVPGPTYMDYVMKYRRDSITQEHHPHIYLDGQRVATLKVTVAPTNTPPAIAALLTPVPPPVKR
jgi:hypothetical protein